MTELEMQQRIAELEQQLAEAKATKGRGLSFKVTQRGAVSVYGLQRFPVTLYPEQWQVLISQGEQVLAFCEHNAEEARLNQAAWQKLTPEQQAEASRQKTPEERLAAKVQARIQPQVRRNGENASV